ncbi:YpbS family protein [Bacillus pinisoli]|uniref:YpbS family protein n=1 Tax=Bacillus pinisoli TaxID=2901866 RepID=UPI001FF14B81|nr:YpbS family protein [Bacillus pinisoli]
MSVHHAITKHSTKQHEILRTFLQLDQLREMYIEEAVSLCKKGVSFSTDPINKVTTDINNLAKQGVVPQRKLVTVEMVQEYVSRQETN